MNFVNFVITFYLQMGFSRLKATMTTNCDTMTNVYVAFMFAILMINLPVSSANPVSSSTNCKFFCFAFYLLFDNIGSCLLHHDLTSKEIGSLFGELRKEFPFIRSTPKKQLITVPRTSQKPNSRIRS